MKKTIILSIIVLISISFMSCSNQTNSNEISVNKETIQMTKSQDIKSGINLVTFKTRDGLRLAGLLFTPENFDVNKKYKTVVFSGPLMQVKEQMGSDYGSAFAKKDYVFLTFDHIGHGDSEGAMGAHEDGFIKIETIRDGISFLSTLDFVDKEKLFALGGCASGSYMPYVAVADKRVKALATVSGYADNKTSYFKEMTKENFIARISRENAARQREYETGQYETYDALGYENLDPTTITDELTKEIYEYYMTERGVKGKYTYRRLASDSGTFLIDAAGYAPYIFMPYIGVVGENAYSMRYTENFYNNVVEPKAFVKIKDATHMSLYDDEVHVAAAVDEMDKFFTANIK